MLYPPPAGMNIYMLKKRPSNANTNLGQFEDVIVENNTR